MKALFFAVAVLTASASFAQTAPVVAQGQATPKAEAAQAPGFQPMNGELRRAPPPGRPYPEPQPPPRNNNLAVVDRAELMERLARLERMIEDLNTYDRRTQSSKVRRAQEQLDSVQQYIAEADPLNGVVAPTPRPPPPPPEPVVRPMPDGSFRNFTNVMSKESFAEDKMRVLSSVVSTNYFLISQVGQVINQFPFSQDKLEAVRVMRGRILDPENGYELYGSFPFSSDKKRLQDLLAGR